jgi:hypothetical protein
MNIIDKQIKKEFEEELNIIVNNFAREKNKLDWDNLVITNELEKSKTKIAELKLKNKKQADYIKQLEELIKEYDKEVNFKEGKL